MVRWVRARCQVKGTVYYSPVDNRLIGLLLTFGIR